jgi:large subunit ribosomal protein L4
MSGSRTGSMELDPQVLGGRVRTQLLKQAIVVHQANRRSGTASTKSRGMVRGSTRKIYRQKGTGNARMGTARTAIRTGGGVAFAKGRQNFGRSLPKKMRRLARNNAILAKAVAEKVVAVDGLSFKEPKTKAMVQLLDGIGATRGCVLALDQPNDNAYRSGRNIPKTDVRVLRELNAYEILRRDTLIVAKAALEDLIHDPVLIRSRAEAEDE